MPEKCPRCGSEAYGHEGDGVMYCLDCKLGLEPWVPDRGYAAQYAFACGYKD